VKPDGKSSSVLLLGASGFLGPALLDAFGGACAVKTHCKHPVKGSLFFDTRSTRVSDVLATLPGEPAAAIIRVIDPYFTRAAVQLYFAAQDRGK
jgi:hypothetical protein